MSDSSVWAEVNNSSKHRPTAPSRNRVLNIKYLVNGQAPIAGASAVIPWCDDYEQALDASKKALSRHLPIISEGWNWWLATLVPDSDSLADISPDAFSAIVAQENAKLYLCGDPVDSDIILYRKWPESENKQYYSFKLLTIGNSGVGKTAFIKYFSTGKFARWAATPQLADQSIRRFTTCSGERIELMVHDTAGQERFAASLPPSIFRNVGGVFLMYDMTENFSAEKYETWVQLARRFDEDVPILLVGCKSDQVGGEKISSEPVQDFKAQQNLLAMIETSSKSGDNVELAFHRLVQEILVRAERSNSLSRHLRGPGVPRSGINLAKSKGSGTWGDTFSYYSGGYSRYC
ncbi:Ras family small GTPase [Ceratobasidium sp. AG-Ba]|nr:Ras family small GTPase [Ceratobasidium sp. AG-Ba]